MTERKGSKLIISLFCSFIALACLFYIFMPKSDFSETEKRYLAQFPSVTAKSLKSGKFSEDFETFLADQTPFRKFFVSVNAYFELFKGNNGSNGVYLGKGGWLFEKPFETSNGFDRTVDSICGFREKTDPAIPVSLVILPEKGEIYSSYLPANHLKYRGNEYISKLEKTARENNMEFFGFAETFLSCGREDLYYKTDHHWTSAGAFEAYKLICEKKGFPVPDIDDYNIETVPGFYGTSYSKSCYTLVKPDTVEVYRNKKTNGNADVTITEGSKKSTYGNMFFTERLSEADKYPVFLDGNHTLVEIDTGREGGNLLVIKDSFAHCLVPFLAENYSGITMIDLRYFKGSVYDLIDEKGITEVTFIFSIDNLATSKDIVFA